MCVCVRVCVQYVFVCVCHVCVCGVRILDLQSIPRESNNKDVAAMLVELTIEANEESFVIVHQHGGNDIKSRMHVFICVCVCLFVCLFVCMHVFVYAKVESYVEWLHLIFRIYRLSLVWENSIKTPILCKT